uniref:DUF4283 domain-containing protein n=1 Tax=Cannabis sativa TaxID=3483 RepID=A0A803Q332_CANSA
MAGGIGVPICVQCGTRSNPCRCKVVGPTLGFLAFAAAAIVEWPVGALVYCFKHVKGRRIMAHPATVVYPKNASLGLITTTLFWVQVYRLPFLFKSEHLAQIIGGLISKYIDIHEDSLNEGWGPFLRIRVDFCYECGVIGLVYDKCNVYLEKLDEGIDSDLGCGPWMEGSPFPKSPYDRYRQDFSKAGPWSFETRLVRNTISPIIQHLRKPSLLPSLPIDREKGKSIMASSTTQSEFSSFAPAFATLSCDIGNNSTKGDSSVVKVISEKSVTTTVSNSVLKENVTPLKRTMNNHCPETSGV